GESNPVEEFFEEAVSREVNSNVLLSYWCDLYPNLAYSPKELYALVAKNLQAQLVPGLESATVMMRESGLFFKGRLYFQLRRERLVFEVCGAPFGNGFFVSSRLFDRRKRPRFWDYCVVFLLLSFLPVPGALLKFGWVWTAIAVTGELALVWTILRL